MLIMIPTMLETLKRLRKICNFQVKVKSVVKISNGNLFLPLNPTFELLGTAHLFFAAYVLLFSIVIMNLLIGLAVSDIGALMEIARRESIISQINMINEMSDRRNTFVYKHCLPQCVKKMFERYFKSIKDIDN